MGKKAEGFVKPGPGKNSDALDDSAKSKNDGSTPLKCSYCKKEGHKIQNCKDPKGRSYEQFRSSFTQPSVKTNTEKPKPVSNVMVPKSVDLFKEFRFDGAIGLSENDKNSVTVLRDTGAATSLLSRRKSANERFNKNYFYPPCRNIFRLSPSEGQSCSWYIGFRHASRRCESAAR